LDVINLECQIYDSGYKAFNRKLFLTSNHRIESFPNSEYKLVNVIVIRIRKNRYAIIFNTYNGNSIEQAPSRKEVVS